MKILKKFFLLLIIIFLVLSAFYFLWLSPRYVVPILMYHRFGYETNSLVVSPENFERQMKYIKDKGYKVISLDSLVRGIRDNRRFVHKTVVITIDDGYEDNYIYAYPVLKKYGFPATIFIIAGLIGREKDFMSWDEINIMLRHNISFGSHTKTHSYLPSVKNKDILLDEIKGSRQLIEDRLRTPVYYFCYPIGGFNENVKAIVKQSGYKGACTTNRGLIALNRDVYELKRIKVTNSDTNKPFSFWAKLSGYYNLFRSKKRGY